MGATAGDGGMSETLDLAFHAAHADDARDVEWAQRDQQQMDLFGEPL